MGDSNLKRLDLFLSKIGAKARPQLLDGIRDGAKKIYKEYLKKGLSPTKESIMKDLTSDIQYLTVLGKADVHLPDIEEIVTEVLSNPEMQTYSDEQLFKEKIGRNAPCPCGSGKKYKKCCGQ